MDSPNSSQMSANRQIARAAGTVMLAFLVSSLFNLIRGIVILRAFGTGMESDAFYSANRIPEFIFNLVAGGALASAFIPTFTTLLTHGKKESAWRLAHSIINLVIAITTLLAVFAAIFAPQVVRYILAPEWFLNNPQKFELTVQLLRLLLPSTIIFGVSGLIMGILNAHQSFLLPALAPSMYSLGMILGVLVLAPSLGIFGLAWGVILGAGLHLLIQLPKLLRLNGKYRLIFGLRDPAVREVGMLMLPRVAGVAVVQINFLVNTNLASGYSEGSVTGLTGGFFLMLMPLMFIAQAIATASLPTFSAQVALGKKDEMRASLVVALKAVLFLSIPASIGLVLLRFPLIQTLYQNGEAFTSESTQLVAWALLWYGIGLVGHSVVEIISRAFYALHDTRTPVMVGVVAMSLNILLSILLGGLFQRIGWMPHGGLALANTIATGLESGALIFLMRRRLQGIDGRNVLRILWKSLAAATIMGLAVVWFLQTVVNQPAWIALFAGAGLGIVVFVFISWLLRVEELKHISQLFLQRVKRQ
ncbi:MAG: murein biosynthesis integral membrane protein MurJ [Chloroflexi bacterium 44-23]|nr:MAG: murein biosynthesis integral membrane protein MurJ [Chloroflexi bacterium 44-23]